MLLWLKDTQSHSCLIECKPFKMSNDSSNNVLEEAHSFKPVLSSFQMSTIFFEPSIYTHKMQHTFMNKCHRYINTVPSKCPMLLSTNQSFDIFPHLNQSSLPLRIFRIFFENHIGAQSAVFEINSRFTWVQSSFENVTLFENAVLLSNLQHSVGFCFSFESAQFYSKIVQHFLWSLRRRILIGSSISEACAVFDRPNVKGCTVSKINAVCLSKCLIIPIYTSFGQAIF